MSVVDKPIINRAFVLAQVSTSSTYFDLLALPAPCKDALGRALWSGSTDDVHRAFRKSSLKCHPDKTSDPEMLGKFQVIRDAKEYLCQEPERLEYCKLVVEAIDALKPVVAMGIDTKSDNDMIAKQMAERRLADELRQQERDQFEGSVLKQMHMRRKTAELKAKARKQKDSSSSESGASSSEGEEKEETLMRKAAGSKKKVRML